MTLSRPCDLELPCSTYTRCVEIYKMFFRFVHFDRCLCMISHLRVGDLDVQRRVLAVRRLSASLLDEVGDWANLVENPKLCGSGRGCRVDEDPLALDHDLQR